MSYISFPTYTFNHRPAPSIAEPHYPYRTAGILGGLAPQSTTLFYKTMTEYCLAKEMPAFPRLIINSVNPWPVTELLRDKDMEGLLHFMKSEIDLIGAQVDFLAIVCNSVHAVLEPLRRYVGVPVLAIHTEVCREVALTGIRKVGILGTKTTVDHAFYQEELVSYGIRSAVLPPAQEAAFDAFIFEEMLHGRGLGTMKKLLLAGIETLQQQGCTGVILACTELALFIDQKDTDMRLFSSTDVLARAVVEECFRV